MGRSPIGTQAMTAAERLRRHWAKHGRNPEPSSAARQQRWRDRQAAEQTAKAATPEPPDPLLAQAVVILEGRGGTDLIRRLHAYWPHMDPAVRRELAAGRGQRHWLRED
jgi:hypothetical protein